MIRSILQSENTQRVMIALNLATSLLVFMISKDIVFNDEKGYILLSESFTHSVFSSWYFLQGEAPPETLRTWGYPFFLFLARQMFDSLFGIKLLQYGFYILALYVSSKILAFFTTSRSSTNLFLLFTLINIQIPFYFGQIGAEGLTIFFATCYFYFLVKATSTRIGVVDIAAMSLVAFIAYQLRPAFLIVPAVATALLQVGPNAKNRMQAFAHLAIFLLSLVPFGVWNYKHHGVFKVTPLQGGGGVMHMGYWSFLLPANYVEKFLWSNDVGDDMFMNLVAERSLQHKEEFEKEWQAIQQACVLTQDEPTILSQMERTNPGIFIVHNSAYTRCQESALWRHTLIHIQERPFFYLKTRLISMFRIWFTGINMSSVRAADTRARIKGITPFVITFCFIFGGMVFISFRLLRYRPVRMAYLCPYVTIVLWGFAHSFFAIQSRYIVPMHLMILVLLAASLTAERPESRSMASANESSPVP